MLYPAGIIVKSHTGMHRPRLSSQTMVRPGLVRAASFGAGMAENTQAESWKHGSRGGTADVDSAALEPWVVRLLACPVDRSAVKLDGSALVCKLCGRRYPVRDGIPDLVSDLEQSEQ